MMDYAAILVIVVFVVAIWNTSIGATGGITFAAMAMLLPPFAVIPIHALVESTSSIARALVLRDFVSWQFVPPFVIGGLLGCLVGVPLMDLDLISDDVLQVILGVTILSATWIPVNHLIKSSGRKISLFGGLGTTFLTLFIGATSPLVSALVNRNCPDQRSLIGTSAACMVFQHGVKILIFGIFGFSFSLYAELIMALLIASILGTWIGRKVLISASQNITRPIFKTIVTMLGIYVAGQGLQADHLLADWSSRAWAGEVDQQKPALEERRVSAKNVDHDSDDSIDEDPINDDPGHEQRIGALEAENTDLRQDLATVKGELAKADETIASLILDRDNHAARSAWNQDRINTLEKAVETSQSRNAKPEAAISSFLAGEQRMLEETAANDDGDGLAARLEATESVLAIIDQQSRKHAAERDALAVKEEAQQERISSLEAELAAARALLDEHGLATDLDEVKKPVFSDEAYAAPTVSVAQ
ncbi:MAG: TSUP family transporter [Geminicoccales bacterium]